MRVAVSGARGLVGSALVAELARAGASVRPMVRPGGAAAPGAIAWDPARGTIDAAAMERLDAVVHLAGEGIAEGRWTPERKVRIRDSRVAGTRLVAETIASLREPPRVLVSASATGFYGDRGDEVLDESSPAGEGFLAEVCRAWEAATAPAEERGVRVVHLRLGVVLAAHGGALAKMLPPFRLGVGGPVGGGRQWMSWITLADLLAAIRHVIATDAIRGACNATSPAPVTNAELARALGRALHRPAVVPVPAFALRAMFGEMADEVLLGGARVLPRKLEASGFRFAHPEIGGALAAVLAPATARP